MFIEIRKAGKSKKYYLVHTYREGDSVKRISRYLGSNLNEKQLLKLRFRAEQLIIMKIEDERRSLVNFHFTEKELKDFRKYDAKISISHLQTIDWDVFTGVFTYNTNAIEGSTLLKSEVDELLHHGHKPHSSDEKEAVNVAEAVEFIRTTKKELSIELIKEMHKICFKGTKHFAGSLRDVDVVVSDGYGKIVHKGAPPKEVPALLNELSTWYKKNRKKYPPLFLAAMVHNQFENIHPFQDGNGRVGRLLMNYVLLRHKYPPINVYLEDRMEYYKTLQRFSLNGNIKATLRFLISQYKKQYKR